MGSAFGATKVDRRVCCLLGACDSSPSTRRACQGWAQIASPAGAPRISRRRGRRSRCSWGSRRAACDADAGAVIAELLEAQLDSPWVHVALSTVIFAITGLVDVTCWLARRARSSRPRDQVRAPRFAAGPPTTGRSE